MRLGVPDQGGDIVGTQQGVCEDLGRGEAGGHSQYAAGDGADGGHAREVVDSAGRERDLLQVAAEQRHGRWC